MFYFCPKQITLINNTIERLKNLPLPPFHRKRASAGEVIHFFKQYSLVKIQTCNDDNCYCHFIFKKLIPFRVKWLVQIVYMKLHYYVYVKLVAHFMYTQLQIQCNIKKEFYTSSVSYAFSLTASFSWKKYGFPKVSEASVPHLQGEVLSQWSHISTLRTVEFPG